MRKSLKRRRAIDVNIGLVRALKERATELETTPTRLATKIMVGDERPVVPHKKSRKAKSVSMTESVWLSIRKRGMGLDKSNRVVMQELLVGEEPPLTTAELEFGRNRAAERERLRAEGSPEEATPTRRVESDPEPKPTVAAEPAPEPAPEPEPEPAPVAVVEVEPEPPQPPLAAASPVRPAPPEAPPPIVHESETVDEKEEAIREERMEEKRQAIRLSKGVPEDVEQHQNRCIKKVEPEREFYGGIFQI